MHVVFMPYGTRSEVELLLRDMESQSYWLPFKEGGGIWIKGAVRILPFGVYEYIFPRASADVVLNTLIFDKDVYNLGKSVLFFIRKFIKCEAIPEYKQEQKFIWVKDNVNIIPIGIRKDIDLFDDLVKSTHEAL